ncbi:MAG: hypothetical protein RRY79_00205 [Clostridia bacterium]
MNENDMNALYYISLSTLDVLNEDANDELKKANENRLNKNFTTISKAIAELYSLLNSTK